ALLRRPDGAVLLDDDPAAVAMLAQRRRHRLPVAQAAADLGAQVRLRPEVLELDVLDPLVVAVEELGRAVADEVLGGVAAVEHGAQLLRVGFGQQPLGLPAMVVLGYWFLIQFFSGLGTLGTGRTTGVAWWAHIGGFLIGVLLLRIVRRRTVA
ncbi:MAG: rhomboid family intramembrane serine protease, partial [Firmicutes bacterium]|nr:rhomboid family intramembrane serine protease [Bacillota bacterium]